MANQTIIRVQEISKGRHSQPTHARYRENIWEVSLLFYQFFFFIIDPTPKLVCLALGNPSDQQHCTIAHISIAPPLFEVYNGFESWFASLSSLFVIWPCSLARSCRRCWCRSAAREGEPRGRQSSCRTALQRCWPALCCAPRNKRLAGYLMWCYNRYTWPSFLQRRRFRQHCSSFSWARWFSNDYLISLHNMNRLATCYLGLNF